ncbi:MAG: ATP-binding protein, partial [Muribaculaceae bacterium]|nr:ATP-binding protein [Muribaculaceae bacterium]
PYFNRLLTAVVEAGCTPSFIDLYVQFTLVPETEIYATMEESRRSGDFRPARLLMTSFRAYPDPPGKKPYCIDFTDNAGLRPVSSVILGNNGSGKTSVYTGLEFMAMQSSNIAEVFGYFSDDQDIYMHHIGAQLDFGLTMYDAIGRCHEFADPARAELCTPAFFSSQADIQEYESEGMTREFLFHQLGRLSLYQIGERLKRIQSVTNIFNEAYKISQRKYNTVEERKQALAERKELQKKAKQLIDKKGGRLPDWRWANDKNKGLIDQLVAFIENEVRQSFEIFCRVSKKIVPALIDPYIARYEPVHIELSVDGLEMRPIVVFDGDDRGHDPMRFFNTFRAKLFILALKISFAFASKIIDKVNFAIVIDDIFDASDFHNKEEIRYFFRELVSGHESIEELRPYPLQIICMTQDQMIAENVYKGIEHVLGDSAVKYLRIHHPAELEETDEAEITIHRPDGNKEIRQVRMVCETIRRARV